MILDHEAVGGVVTHCGWNSTREGIGVGVGAQTWIGMMGGEPVKKDAIEKALKRVMVGEEAEKMGKRAKELGQKARMAMEEGGSSYNDFNSLIEDLRYVTFDVCISFLL
ncbi:hypothetical protein TanjilG_13120 [Lupinus angustifolius]|uniref:Uncharacterized protein n=1 Tax=Lupinus angustifolius TaxID=3871 RepID=A0A1J7FYT3_LUPAN|nr:hypothetical protein TanjilG_13120 [Lupinus angustifolius]